MSVLASLLTALPLSVADPRKGFGDTLEKPEEINAYRNVVKGLSDAALDEGQSKEVIANLAIDLYGGRRDYRDRG